MTNLEGKVLIAQGGGPTAVINQSIVGIALEARKFTQVKSVYGAEHGIDGILGENFFDLSQETTNNLEKIGNTPSSALGSTRSKPTPESCREMFKIMQAHDIRYFFYIGGNDSSDTCRIINDESDKSNYELRCIHVPKTIDNDLMGSDHTPGFGSAARFVANAFVGADLDNRALPGVYIGVVMGRNAGFLTASSALARKYPDDGPHLIYIPERDFDIDDFITDVKEVYEKHGRCIIAVSEGIKDKSGEPIISKLMSNIEKDAHGNIQLSGTGALGDLLSEQIKKNTNIKRVRSDTFGYLQRSFMGCVSDIDAKESREVGEKAVHFAFWHNLDGSVAIERIGNYSVDYKILNFEAVAAKTRIMPDSYINKNDVTDKFLFHTRPLIGSGFLNSHRIRAPRASKIVNN